MVLLARRRTSGTVIKWSGNMRRIEQVVRTESSSHGILTCLKCCLSSCQVDAFIQQWEARYFQRGLKCAQTSSCQDNVNQQQN